ncbi:hypothetical protein ACIHCQ_33890 [Streptomyces sp. NPDC052236]|uniref:hypothetical protein n=1 Tax=Streptomyces sp. NPDC052236 TaxID=3365686 RepID=UPI0037CCCB6D
MKTTQVESAQHHTTPVVVTLSGCSKEDAHTVFRVLRQTFPCDRADDDVPQYGPHPHATVWTATYEVSPERVPVGPQQLSESVETMLQGGYWGVDRMLETLGAAFDVQDEGMAAGDQEKEVQVRLMSGSR